MWHVRLSSCGLSPRVRGSPTRSEAHGVRSRVYPRVCGGAVASVMACASVVGLSPRVRGSLRRAACAFVLVRSIPACAGEPAVELPGWSRYAVYPRVCGGACVVWHVRLSSRGLSPRVRGSRASCGICVVLVRSIPACAGERGSPTMFDCYPVPYGSIPACAGEPDPVRGCQ